MMSKAFFNLCDSNVSNVSQRRLGYVRAVISDHQPTLFDLTCMVGVRHGLGRRRQLNSATRYAQFPNLAHLCLISHIT